MQGTLLHVDIYRAARFAGRAVAPGDKSISHRALILAALADGTCEISHLATGEDVRSTARCLQALGADLRVEGNAGGGMVTVVVNGAKQIQSLKIDPEVVSNEDVEMLQDLIIAAINDAHRKAEEEMSQKMGGMLPPGLKIPGL